ncbi:MAG: aminoglycoside phosphotransferase family protein [Ardenticatenaceae bacterium]|nr:aminoglycoside phosphotransferase family protein [Anaerolineales bacterium]MCB9006140.1 aminoglycoside phosphotransferase family protein [Ardenticatenaceae bacterium]
MGAEPFIQAIQTAYPGFVVETAVFIEDGQYNHVLLLNDDTIFRFPRFVGGVEQLALETKILTAVQPFLPLPVPNPSYIQFQNQKVGLAFMGYQLIPGEPLMPAAFAKIEDKTAVARQIAAFLQALHTVPIRDLIDEPLPLSDTPEEWWDVYGRIQTNLFPYMRLDACKSVAHHFESVLDDPQQMQYEPVLRHGDFGTGNLLHDPVTQQMSGIIDFGFAVLGDPAFDVAGLLTYGEPFVQEIARFYPAVHDFWPRVRFYKGTFALIEALYGIENGDDLAFQRGLEAYV